MLLVLRIVLGLPLLVGAVWLWTSSAKSKRANLWLLLFLLYTALYLAVFHFWLKQL